MLFACLSAPGEGGATRWPTPNASSKPCPAR